MGNTEKRTTLDRLVDYFQHRWVDHWTNLATRRLNYGDDGWCPDWYCSRNLIAAAEANKNPNLSVQIESDRIVSIIHAGIAYHDIGLAYYVPENEFVKENGKFVESGIAGEVILYPRDAYDQSLISDVQKIQQEWDLSTV